MGRSFFRARLVRRLSTSVKPSVSDKSDSLFTSALSSHWRFRIFEESGTCVYRRFKSRYRFHDSIIGLMGHRPITRRLLEVMIFPNVAT